MKKKKIRKVSITVECDGQSNTWHQRTYLDPVEKLTWMAKHDIVEAAIVYVCTGKWPEGYG